MGISNLHFSQTLKTLSHPRPVTVRDTEGAYLGGRWKPGADTVRKIRAIVLQLKPEELHLPAQGEISAGGIVLHTRATLYFTDLTGKGDALQARQSFVQYGGYCFRVVADGLMKNNADYNTYQAVRYDAR
jgi:hypothetical protein